MTESTPDYYFYLHGFASSPLSVKAQYLQRRFANLGLELKLFDLNQGDFSHLTLTRQLKQVESEIQSLLELEKSPNLTLIGSSFGGLTAAWLAHRNPEIKRLILLAPAWEFLSNLLTQFGSEKLAKWQKDQDFNVNHFAEKKELPLHYQFITDLTQYPDEKLTVSSPTLILHGREDEVIPLTASRRFILRHPGVKLIELDSDHSLGNVLPEIGEMIEKFCQLS